MPISFLALVSTFARPNLEERKRRCESGEQTHLRAKHRHPSAGLIRRILVARRLHLRASTGMPPTPLRHSSFVTRHTPVAHSPALRYYPPAADQAAQISPHFAEETPCPSPC